MNKQQLEVMAVQAFMTAKTTRLELFSATEKSLYINMKLEDAKSAAFASGKIDGKNAEIREGQLREKLTDHYTELAIAQNAERAARRDYDIAMLDVDSIKILLRIAELPVT